MKKAIPHFFKVLIILITISGNLKSQDIHFSQFFETPLLRNPALAGLFSGDVRVQGAYRSQWNSVTDAYKTGSFNAEVKKRLGQSDDFITIGAEVLYDRSGTAALTATHILPAVNYHKSLNADRNSYLSLGAMGGWVQRSIDRSKITTNTQFNGSHYDPTLPDGESFAKSSYSYIDASIGLSYNSQLGANPDDNIYLGIAYHHLSKPKKISFYSNNKYEMMAKWVGSAGLRMNIADKSYLTIEGDYSKQGTYSETIAGVLFSWKLGDTEDPKYSFHAGAYVRWKDAFIPVAKLEFKPVTVAVSYDVNISQLKTASNSRGGFEISLTYQKFFNNDNSSLEAIRCPRF